MKSTNGSILKITLHSLVIAILITMPAFATWAASVDNEDVKLWKMWIKLAWDGYAEPMGPQGERPWWRIWE